MALWYFSALLFAIFSGLYFTYDPGRIKDRADNSTEVAGLFDACRKAAITEAYNDPSLGLALPVMVGCNAAGLPNTAAKRGLNVPGIKIQIQKAALIDPLFTGRIVTTYIEAGDTVMNVPFTVAVAQIRDAFSREHSTGYVVAGSVTWHMIQNGLTDNSKLPAAIPLGAIASFHPVN